MNEKVENELGTIYVPHRPGVSGAGDGTNRANTAGIGHDRDVDYEYTLIEPVNGFIQLKAINKYDVGYVSLDGKAYKIDFGDTTVRPYNLVARANVDSTIEIAGDVSGYKTDPAIVQVHRGQVIVLRFVKSYNGTSTKWFTEVNGETDGLIQKVVFQGQEFTPNTDGTISISIDKILEKISNDISKAFADVVLYWNN